MTTRTLDIALISLQKNSVVAPVSRRVQGAAATTPSRLQRDRSTDAGESLSDKFQTACAISPVAPGRAQ
jgi:hypothetical protein